MTINIINLIIHLAMIGFLIFIAINSKKRLRKLKEEERELQSVLGGLKESTKKRIKEAEEFFSNLDTEIKKMEENLEKWKP